MAEVRGPGSDCAVNGPAASEVEGPGPELVGGVDHVVAVVVVGLVTWPPVVADHGEVPTWARQTDFYDAPDVYAVIFAERPRSSRGARIEVVSVSHGLASSRKERAG